MQAVIRELREPKEFKQLEALQRAVWNWEDLDVLPAAAFIAITHEGGLTAAAFDGERMVGFVFGFPTADPRRHHSHLLAVLPEYRRTGLAVRLKLYQREWCLKRGIEQVVWTFDPLQAVNANFNIRKLGCVVRTYLPDYYGPVSGRYAGAPTDRFLAEWNLTSPRVLQRLQGGSQPDEGPLPSANAVVDERPVRAYLELDAARLVVRIPTDFGALLARDPALAVEWRLHARELFGAYFRRGYVITDFRRTPAGNEYILQKGDR